MTNEQLEGLTTDLELGRWTPDAMTLWASCEELAAAHPDRRDLAFYVTALTAMDELGWHETSAQPMRDAVYAMLAFFADALLDARGVTA